MKEDGKSPVYPSSTKKFLLIQKLQLVCSAILGIQSPSGIVGQLPEQDRVGGEPCSADASLYTIGQAVEFHCHVAR